jgi:hypothetical protein
LTCPGDIAGDEPANQIGIHKICIGADPDPEFEVLGASILDLPDCLDKGSFDFRVALS